ncbi:ParA family protein [uncultured Propionivibrio sp.]|uniref:ParA family protein n=1 Tax=uncultured Propionivibrio sp. TaxID=426737 RepID=UPI0029BFE7F7|nr:ParA family protein [uncultured Propionivibrio sp.]
MKSIAFFNNKGGVGKTTLLCNLAGYLGTRKDLRILVIDADPQSNATAYLLDEAKIAEIYSGGLEKSLYGYYESVERGKGYSDEIPFVTKSPRFCVDLLPGHPRFALREDLLARDWSETLTGKDRGLQTTYAFRHLLNTMAPNYDLILVDMGPSLGAINRSILLATNHFLTPMSADLFSLMAVENILLSLATWNSDINMGLGYYQKNNQQEYVLDDVEVKWSVSFLGYVMQQYKMQTIAGKKRPVKAYDEIIKRFPDELDELENQFGLGDIGSAKLGEFPSLFSLIPMSQTAHAPVFGLQASDGVVGAHFSMVDSAATMFEEISVRLLKRLSMFEEAPK